MSARPTRVAREVKAGCLNCGASWVGGSAQGTAASHFDRTGHETWCEVHMVVRYGSGGAPAPVGKPAAKAPPARAAVAGFVGLPPKRPR